MKRTAPRAAAKKTGAATKKAGARAKRAGVEGKKSGAAELTRLTKALAAAEAERDEARSGRDAALAHAAEAAERQAATTDILHAIAASPGEAEATLRKICETTARLFGAAGVALRIAEGDEYTLFIGVGRGAEEVTESLHGRAVERHPVRAHTIPGAVIRGNRQLHIPDLDRPDPEIADWPSLPILRAAGIRTMLGTPLRREGRAVGALLVYRAEPRPFDAAELHLLQSFADQAVIAIENARLLNELRESLDRQTATADILRVIASTPGDATRALDTIAAAAVRMFNAHSVHIRRLENNSLRAISAAGSMSVATRGAMPDVPLDRALIAGICVRENRQIHLEDVAAEPTVSDAPIGRLTQQLGARTQAHTPLTQEGNAIGVMIVSRNEVRPFRPDELELMRGFADQAVIAIENARLLTELRESLARQTATAEVLSVISSSPGDLQPVFDAMLRNAMHICEAHMGFILRLDHDVFIPLAQSGVPPAFAEYLRQSPSVQLGPGSAVLRMAQSKATVQVPDAADLPNYRERASYAVALVELGRARTTLFVPMLREGEVIGSFTIYRPEVRPFDAKQVALVENLADQAMIAIENARLLSELRESLDRQTATADILRVIASTPGDPTRALDTIADTAVRMFNAQSVHIRRVEDNVLRVVAAAGSMSDATRSAMPDVPIDQALRAGVCVRENRQIHIEDIAADPTRGGSPVARLAEQLGIRTQAFTPLTQNGEAIGAMVVNRGDVRPFEADELELMKGFADQAVIAIENARLLTELRGRTEELTESLDRQTAISEVLGVISASPGDVGPVFDVILDNALRLCEASMGEALRVENGRVRYVASRGAQPEYAQYMRENPVDDMAPGGELSVAIRSGAPVQAPDLLDAPAYKTRAGRHIVATVELGGIRTVLWVPLLKDDAVIGFIGIYRREVRPFSQRHIDVVENFAKQAVIAIENARLLGEIKEALANQTASAEVLRTIAGTPAEAGRALDTIAEVAARLFDTASVNVLRLDGNILRHAASFGRLADTMRTGVPEIPLDPNSASGVALLERRQIAFDNMADPEVVRRFPATMVAAVKIAPNGGSEAVTPLLREGQAVGAIVTLRDVVRPFTEKELAQLRNFADQAVIAIENARLLTELREALERQTATAEILRVIASTPGDAQRALNTIAETTARLFAGTDSMIVTVESDRLHHAAVAGTASTHVVFEGRDLPLDSNSMPSMVVRECRQIHVPDLDHVDPSISAHSPGLAPLRATGRHVVLGTPLMREGRVIGALMITRSEAKPFDEQERTQVANFADQAVIAIENARLLNELRESLDRQTAMADVLGVISASPGEMRPVFETILANATRLCEATQGVCFTYDGARFHLGASLNAPTGFADPSDAGFAMPPESNLGRMAASGEPVQDLDLAASASYRNCIPAAVLAVEVGGVRTVLHVPLIKDRAVVGAIVVYRNEVRAFDEKHVALVQNFAAQAVIAIENARLLNEIREALERQTATAEILRVIASTPGDAQRALDTIAETTARLFAGTDSWILTVEGDRLRYAAIAGTATTQLLAAVGHELPLNSSNLPGMVVLERRQIHVPDLDHIDPSIAHSPGFAPLRAAGRHVVLGTPLMREGRAIGVLAIARSEAKPFDEQELAQIANFADQAVIAIENARLLNEIREALERQTATAEILRVIASTPGDAQRALNAIAETTARLFAGADSSILTVEGDRLRHAAFVGAASTQLLAEAGRDLPLDSSNLPGTVVLECRQIHVPDLDHIDPSLFAHSPGFAPLRAAGRHVVLGTPLMREGRAIGTLMITRSEAKPFDEQELAQIANFADQAVIAIENARLLNELRESLDRQTAMSEVLRVISSSPGELDPVFQAIVASAARICETELSSLQLHDGQNFKMVALHGVMPAADIEWRARHPQGFSGGPKTITGQVAATRRTVHIADYSLSEAYAERDPLAVASVEHLGIRTVLGVPMVKDDRFLGLITVFRQEVRPFTEKQIELVENFAAQAVIAIENARLLNELRARTDELARRQAELRVTFDNMGDGVIMFDGEHRLVSWNRNLQQILDLPDPFFAKPRTFRDYITYLIERGEFGAVDLETELRRYADTGTRPRRTERTRPNGRVLEVRNNPVPGGGFVTIYSDVTERTRAEEQIRAARDAAEKALSELKAAQANLIQAEKMASLGQLTAGIAHEIKNPLNFVNNFAGLSVELLDELKVAAQDAIAVLDGPRRAEIDEVVTMLTSNLEKIAEHGRRADGIVKSMLAHSRGSSGERQSVNINALIEESLNLAYHGARAQDQNFNVTLERDLDASLAPIEVVPQDMTRVFLNLFGNGFYAANKRRAAANDAGFKPLLKVTTRERDGEVAISIRDNGIGIPPEIRAKLFEPFFTTKPTGEGTGLGLSISYEIVTQQHGGTIEVESEVGAFTEFTVRLPRRTGAQA